MYQQYEIFRRILAFLVNAELPIKGVTVDFQTWSLIFFELLSVVSYSGLSQTHNSESKIDGDTLIFIEKTILSEKS